MVIPSFDFGTGALCVACKEQSFDEMFAVASLLGLVAFDDHTDGAKPDFILGLVKSVPGKVVVCHIDDAGWALQLLDAGAARVVVDCDILNADTTWTTLPKERVWAEIILNPGDDLAALSEPLKAIAGGFHFVFTGEPDVAAVTAFAKTLDYHKVSVAAVSMTATQVGALDRAGADVRVGVGTPLLTGMEKLPDLVAACLRTDRTDGLWSTIIVDENGVAVGFAYSDIESLRTAISQKVGAYHSRSRNALWIKGATSGATQELLGIALDCDRDALRFTVRQKEPGFCHEHTWSCWGATAGLPALSRLLAARAKEAPVGSYTHRLLNDPALLASKLREEAGELIEASAQDDRKEVAAEAADVIYFTLVHLAKHGVSLAEVERVLDARHYKVTRRKGDAKPGK